MDYNRRRRQKSWPKIIISILILLILVVGGSVFLIRREYNQNLRPLSRSQQSKLFTIEAGSTVKQVADRLQEEELIRSDWAFEFYFRANNLSDHLKAGTYSLRPDMSVSEIAGIITVGEVATDQVTILPGKRLDEVRSILINSGFSVEDVDAALDPVNYPNHPALVDKPSEANLEGYIFPETFQKNASSKPQNIIAASLDELHKVLTQKVRADIAKQGLTIHEAIILASIIEKEAGAEDEKPRIAQVFIKRLDEGMKLQSDATASYGAVLNGEADELSERELLLYESRYNTYNNEGLTPGPISNFNASSIEAVANPSSTDYLYFVSGKDCKTRFSNTIEEHEALIEKHGVRDASTRC